jgi:hypothetical protein
MSHFGMAMIYARKRTSRSGTPFVAVYSPQGSPKFSQIFWFLAEFSGAAEARLPSRDSGGNVNETFRPSAKSQ